MEIFLGPFRVEHFGFFFLFGFLFVVVGALFLLFILINSHLVGVWCVYANVVSDNNNARNDDGDDTTPLFVFLCLSPPFANIPIEINNNK